MRQEVEYTIKATLSVDADIDTKDLTNILYQNVSVVSHNTTIASIIEEKCVSIKEEREVYGETNDLTTVWSFVERYYPNYSSCDIIAYNNDLSKILDGDIDSLLFKEIEAEIESDIEIVCPPVDMVLDEIKERLVKSNEAIYQKAIEGFINQNK